MSKVKIEGNASGSGTLTISAPNTNTDRSLTLPDTAGEIITSSTIGSNMPSGSVLQVVSTTANPSFTSTTSTSYVDSGLSLGITLTSSSNKVLILVNGGHSYVQTTFPNGMIETICRQSSTTYSSSNDLANVTYGFSQIYNSANLNTAPHSMNYLDTPSTTTPTYRVFFRSRTGGSVVWQEGSSKLTMTLMEIAG